MVCQWCQAFAETSLGVDVAANDPDEEEDEDSSHDCVFDNVASLESACQL